MPEVNHSEFTIVKYLDVATPNFDRVSGDLKGAIGQVDSTAGDAFVFDGTKAGGDVSPYMEWKLKEVLISGVIQNGDTAVDPNNPNLTAVQTDPADTGYSGVNIPAQMIARATGVTGNQLLLDDDGFDFKATEAGEVGDAGGQTVQKLSGIWGGSGSEAYLDDGGFVINWFPTETVHPTAGDDVGMIIYGAPTETVSPIASGEDGGFVIYGFPTETIRPMESLHPFEVLI